MELTKLGRRPKTKAKALFEVAKRIRAAGDEGIPIGEAFVVLRESGCDLLQFDEILRRIVGSRRVVLTPSNRLVYNKSVVVNG